MSRLTVIIVLACFLFTACNHPDQDAVPGTPAALQENKSSGLGLSKRGYDDLVEELYNELREKDPELQELEEMIGVLDEQKNDSLSKFRSYDGRIKSYYHFAEQHLEQISDSLLRQRMRILIDGSLAGYKNKISRHSRLIETLDIKSANLANLHIILKLTRTIPLIEKFQSDNLPSSKPIEEMVRNFDKAIQKADSLTRK